MINSNVATHTRKMAENIVYGLEKGARIQSREVRAKYRKI